MDQYYSSDSGALLFMGTSTATPLPPPGSDSFTEVPLLGTITPPAIEKSVGRFNIQNDKSRRSVGGKLGDQVIPGDLVIDWTELVHQQMQADGNQAGAIKRNWYITYPDSGNRRLDFVAFVSKWNERSFDSSEEAVEHRVDFELSIDGAVTVTP